MTMSFKSLMAAAQNLNASMEALAALGAQLSLRRKGEAPERRVADILARVTGHIDSEGLSGLDETQETILLNYIRTFFRQALDLLENPARPSGWTYEDPLILQTIGQGSRLAVERMNLLRNEYPAMERVLEAPGAFLDVGAGVGWLAIQAAMTWPLMRVTGIDIFEPALKLAAQNIASSGVEDRVEIRRQSIEDLAEEETYSLVWLAGPFIPKHIIPNAVTRISKALKPGGVMVFGLFGAPPSELGQALTELRIVRSGGHPWAFDEAAKMLTEEGFEDVRHYATGTPVNMVVGTKPG
jgi:SAM-dependent methyltransferase